MPRGTYAETRRPLLRRSTLVIEVTRATVPERPIREVPFPVLD
jgi:hypothetical protein